MASLSDYKKKRRFYKTPEPGPEKKTSEFGNIFVVQKHRATQLHYDFRLEADGVLKSWAVPKGPPMDPKVKRLAMQVEDHPVDYADFEGVIPEGEYGGGTVMVWDYGVYAPENTDNVSRALAKGELKFTVLGKKLKGSFVLVRTRERQWLLMKHRDDYALDGEDITETQPYSVLTKRTLTEIAEDEGGEIKKAATGDPKKLPPRRGIKRRKKSTKKKVWHSNKGAG
jgi:bifunctional non-homologous end joining protein LigD